jgi:1,3-beta-glucan synthase
MLANCCGDFGSIIAGIAHTGSVIGLVGFFEFLWILERFNISHAVLGMIATMA